MTSPFRKRKDLILPSLELIKFTTFYYGFLRLMQNKNSRSQTKVTVVDFNNIFYFHKLFPYLQENIFI